MGLRKVIKINIVNNKYIDINVCQLDYNGSSIYNLLYNNEHLSKHDIMSCVNYA